MSQDRRMPLRIQTAWSVLAACVFLWILLGQQSNEAIAAQQSNFRGGSPSIVDSEDVRTYEGSVEWLEAVSDEEYRAEPSR